MRSKRHRALSPAPSYAIGGDLEGPGTDATHDEGDIFVAEADESDRSFQKYDPEVAIVLNVELDHHANYASMDEIYDSFETFVGKVVPGGTLVISADQPGAVELTRRVRDLADLKVVTYGSAEDADVRFHKVTPRGLTSEVTVLLNGVCRIVNGGSYPGPVNIDDLEWQADRNGGVPPRVVDSLPEHGHVDLVVRAAAERGDWFCAQGAVRVLKVSGECERAWAVMKPFAETGWLPAVSAGVDILLAWGRVEEALTLTCPVGEKSSAGACEVYAETLVKCGRVDEAISFLEPHLRDRWTMRCLVAMTEGQGRDARVLELLVPLADEARHYQTQSASVSSGRAPREQCSPATPPPLNRSPAARCSTGLRQSLTNTWQASWP